MKLNDLFEQEKEQEKEPLYPGEQRLRDGIKIRDYSAIEYKLSELKDALSKSQSLQDKFKQDTQLQKALQDLIARLTRKQEFVNKIASRPTTSQLNIIEEIKRDCSDFIKIVQETNEFLYRGIKSYASAFEGLSRTSRKTLHSKPEISDYVDQVLMDHGFKALRKASIFTTSNKSFAGTFGYTVYLIFPKNGFHFLSTTERDLIFDDWLKLANSAEVNELLVEIRAWVRDHAQEYENSGEDTISDPTGEKRNHFFNLQRAIEYGYTDSVFTLLRKNFEQNNLFNMPDKFNKTPKDLVTPESVLQRLKPNSTDLVDPMLDGKEILINGEYWALRANQWETLMRKLFFTNTHGDSNFETF